MCMAAGMKGVRDVAVPYEPEAPGPCIHADVRRGAFLGRQPRCLPDVQEEADEPRRPKQ